MPRYTPMNAINPGRPWSAVLPGPPEVTGGDMVAAMDTVGVDGALLVSPFTMYRYDASYAPRSSRRSSRPVRIDQAGRSDRSRGGRYDRRLDGHRWYGRHPDHDDSRGINRAADPDINQILATAARHSQPVNLLCWGRLEQVGLLAARNPETMLVSDH